MNCMEVARLALAAAQVPASLHEQCMACLQEAKGRNRGLFRHLLHVRWRMAPALARRLPWDAETVAEVFPDLANCGVAPNLANGINGDNQPWADYYQMPDGSLRQLVAFGHPRGGELPQPLKDEAARDLAARREAIVRAGGVWVKAAPATIPVELDANPDSLEYRTAIARNYWAKGHHPRSKRARLAWLRRNGGEHEAWARGRAIAGGGIQSWQATRGRWRFEVLSQGGVWQVNAQLHLFGRWQIGWRLGYEIDNARHAHPRPGFDRRACLTWSLRPERLKKENAS